MSEPAFTLARKAGPGLSNGPPFPNNKTRRFVNFSSFRERKFLLLAFLKADSVAIGIG